MKFILILSSVLVFAYALPAYDDVPIDRNDPRNYKNIEILILESAVDQDGGYSFSFENDDGSKVSQEGQREIVDDEHSVDRIRGSYSYNDVNGQPVSLTYTADENGYRPVGAHLPTPPPVPLEILRSLRFLATAKPFVDEQLYDYKPKKKVFRGRQYSKANIPIRSRNSLRSTKFSEPLTDSPTSGVFLKSTDNLHDSATEATTTASTTTASTTTASTTTASTTKASATTLAPSAQPTSETTSEAAPAISDKTKPAVQTTLDVLNDSKKNINEAIRESIKKTSQLAQSATQETANAAIAGIREEAAKLTDKVKLQVTKINEKVAVTSAEIDVSKPVKESRDLIELYTKFVPDVVDEALIDVASPKDAQVGRNARLFP